MPHQNQLMASIWPGDALFIYNKVKGHARTSKEMLTTKNQANLLFAVEVEIAYHGPGWRAGKPRSDHTQNHGENGHALCYPKIVASERGIAFFAGSPMNIKTGTSSPPPPNPAPAASQTKKERVLS